MYLIKKKIINVKLIIIKVKIFNEFMMIMKLLRGKWK